MKTMNGSATWFRASTLAAAAASTLLLGGAGTMDFSDRPFDFSNSFYRQNGVNPAAIAGRVDGVGESVVDNSNQDPTRRNIRVLQTVASFDNSGHPAFFNVFGVLPNASAFTNNAAGRRARQIADQFAFYVFPRAANPDFALFPKNQDDLIDTRNGYFSNDPLGLWVTVFVEYNSRAFNTQEGRETLADLAERNGRTLDGTPVVRTMSDLDELRSKGLVRTYRPPADGSRGPRWIICPVIEDPRDGAIAPDAFLDIVRDPDGTPLDAEQDIADEFKCLQTTGDDCD